MALNSSKSLHSASQAYGRAVSIRMLRSSFRHLRERPAIRGNTV
jgi:hypothetical protein